MTITTSIQREDNHHGADESDNNSAAASSGHHAKGTDNCCQHHALSVIQGTILTVMKKNCTSTMAQTWTVSHSRSIRRGDRPQIPQRNNQIRIPPAYHKIKQSNKVKTKTLKKERVILTCSRKNVLSDVTGACTQ